MEPKARNNLLELHDVCERGWGYWYMLNTTSHIVLSAVLLHQSHPQLDNYTAILMWIPTYVVTDLLLQ